MGLVGLALAVAKSPPHLSFNADHYDFGKVDEGVQLKHSFTIKNTGGSSLTIHNAYSTCGCTVPKLEKHLLKPGESTSLQVIIDTAMKQNVVTKTVFVNSNDPRHHRSTLYLTLDVRDPHIGMSTEAKAKIFSDERCAACHVAQGVGLYGEELYRADCAMCHGIKARGAVGPTLLGPYDNLTFAQQMKRIISFGSKTHRSMPGFLGEAGGPLDQEQVDSLVVYLSKLSKAK